MFFKEFFIFFIVFQIFSNTYGLNMNIDGFQKNCLKYVISQIKGDSTKISIMLSTAGELSSNIKYRIIDDKEIIMFESEGKGQILQHFIVNSTRNISICAENLDENNKKISFSITNEEILKENNIENSALTPLENLNNKIKVNLDQIMVMTEAQKLRILANNDILNKRLNSLRMSILIKVIVVISISFLQIYLLKKFIPK